MTTRRPSVVIVGGGAAGTLVALHLVRVASRRSTSLYVTVVDPSDMAGVAFGTTDERHLLNVPAAGMSALPEDPGHFVNWRRRTSGEGASYDFAPRKEFARYLQETLTDAVAGALGEVSLRRVRREAVTVDRTGTGVAVTVDDGSTLVADALVVATGLPATGSGWAPEALRDSAFYVPDPWAPGALDVVRRDRLAPADVLVVGTGLTMVDVTMSVTGADCRPERVVHAISRSGRLPRGHCLSLCPRAEWSRHGCRLAPTSRIDQQCWSSRDASEASQRVETTREAGGDATVTA